MRDQLVADIVLILEIEVECPLCHACLFHDVGYGSLAEALGGEEFKSSFQKRVFLEFFVYIDLAHLYTPFL